MNHSDPVDLITLLGALLAFIVSKEIAAIVSPYAGICVCACAGAAVSISGTDRKMTVPEAAWYVSMRVVVAIAVTVALAEVLNAVASWAKPRYTLIPLAFGIGWIKDYNSVRSWFGSIIDRFASRKADGR